MSPHLLVLPTELLEHILVFLCHENAPSIQACRQTCRTLNATIARSILIHYLEHLALLGMYEPLLPVRGEDASASITLALPERVEALRAWEDAWNALSGGDGNTGVFWQERRPDLCIPRPKQLRQFWNPSSQWSSQQNRRILATIIDPDPPPGPDDDVPSEPDHEMLDQEKAFPLGHWFIVLTHNMIEMGVIYSYLDLHGCLGEAEVEGGVPCGIQSGEENNRDPDFDRMRWTIIDIRVRDVVEIVLSVELDLAIVISIVKTDFPIYEEGKTRIITTHLAVRPLRFLDGSLHPCAMVPTIRFSMTGTTERPNVCTQVFGDYLLLWIIGESLEPCGVTRLYLISWKQGSVTLLLDDPVGRYGAAHMISNAVVALLQLDPPGIELCRVSNMQNEREGMINGHHGHGGQSDGPRMDKLCTLLLPQLRQRNSSVRAGVSSVRYYYQKCRKTFSDEQWPNHRQVPLCHVPQRHMFRHSTRDRIISIMLWITGCEGRQFTLEIIVRCATLLDYADDHGGTSAVPTARNGDDDGQSASAPLVGDVSTEGGNDDGAVPWDKWGPQATAMFENSVSLSKNLSGERRAHMRRDDQIRIQDYNPYRIRQARASMKSLRRRGGDSHEREGSTDTVIQSRVVESNTIPGGEWFEEDVTTELPYLETVVDVPGCRAFHIEQDQVLLHMDDLNKGRGPNVGGIALYNM